MEFILRIVFLIILVFAMDLIRLLFGRLILKINPKSKFGFRVYAMAAASSFGLFSKDIASKCNLDKPCESCRLWTCEKYHRKP